MPWEGGLCGSHRLAKLKAMDTHLGLTWGTMCRFRGRTLEARARLHTWLGAEEWCSSWSERSVEVATKLYEVQMLTAPRVQGLYGQKSHQGHESLLGVATQNLSFFSAPSWPVRQVQGVPSQFA